MSHLVELSREDVRERVFRQIEQLQPLVRVALAPGKANVVQWDEIQLWVDQQRHLVMTLAKAERLGFADSETATPSTKDELLHDSCRYSRSNTWTLIKFLGSWVSGAGRLRTFPELWADFVNFAVLQPMVNPPFGSLFWLALESDIDPHGPLRRNMGLAVGRLAFDMTWYPDSRVESTKVREAQVSFLHEHYEPGLAEGKWHQADEAAWTARCAEILHAQKAHRVFGEIAARAREFASDAE